ncbi:hypothetical protein ILUMI_02107 [Ignelater luminosus]|uniref:Uncharacterized protein n=1 Tax=Ignelater luminosus TaxID=2038154 RepID=A0A8K0DDB8_IGNLU|nr:hypothetical protein ILUMI_02107 [Ignelater luminosus]
MGIGPINHILTFDTAHDMWQKLLTVYDKMSEVSVHMVQVFNYKYEGQGLAAHVSSLEDISNQLKQLGEDMSDRMLITKILMTLPNEFAHFAPAWGSVDKHKQTLNELMSQLLIDEECIKFQDVTDEGGGHLMAPKACASKLLTSKVSAQEIWYRDFEDDGDECCTSCLEEKQHRFLFYNNTTEYNNVGEMYLEDYSMLSAVPLDENLTYDKATTGPDREYWKLAMEEAMKALSDYET